MHTRQKRTPLRSGTAVSPARCRVGCIGGNVALDAEGAGLCAADAIVQASRAEATSHILNGLLSYIQPPSFQKMENFLEASSATCPSIGCTGRARSMSHGRRDELGRKSDGSHAKTIHQRKQAFFFGKYLIPVLKRPIKKCRILPAQSPVRATHTPPPSKHPVSRPSKHNTQTKPNWPPTTRRTTPGSVKTSVEAPGESTAFPTVEWQQAKILY